MKVTAESPSQLDLFWKELKKGGFISGEGLSKKLGLSKVAIWKGMKKLTELGYEIETRKGKGYRLVREPNLPYPWKVRDLLRAKVVGRRILFFSEVDSTQRVLRDLAMKGEEEGTVVMAKKQRKGRGRLDRVWISTEKDLKLSILLRPETVHPTRLGLLSLIGGLAVSRCVKEAKMKWPNDVLIGGRKVAGILVEASAEADRFNYVILGIGVNVNSTKEDLRGVKDAISMYEMAGEEMDMAEVASSILSNLDDLYLKLVEGRWEEMLKEIKERLDTLGKDVLIKGIGEEFRGKAVDLDDRGFLLVRVGDEIKSIMAGDVIHLRASP